MLEVSSYGSVLQTTILLVDQMNEFTLELENRVGMNFNITYGSGQLGKLAISINIWRKTSGKATSECCSFMHELNMKGKKSHSKSYDF